MTHSIPYYIREQLREDRTVCVPGVGVFELLQHAATFSEGRSVLLPPSLSLVFTEQQGNSSPLVERISTVENLSEEKAEKKLLRYAEGLFNKLLNLNQVHIEGIGTLQKTTTDRILFSDTVASLTDELNGLQSLRLNPIQHMANSEPDFNTTGGDENGAIDLTVQPSPSRPWWIPILGGLLLALIYVLTQKTCKGDSGAGVFGDSGDRIEESRSAKAEETLVDVPIDDTDTSNNLGAGTQEADSEDDSAVITEAEVIAAELDNSAEAEEEAVPTLTEDTMEEVVEEEADLQTTAPRVPVTPEQKETTESGTSAIKSVSYDGQTCIIVVGAFGKAKNVLRMMERVEGLGYQVYTSEYNGLTRVGLQFSCKAEELDRYIAEARTKLESKAWYLQSPQG